MSSLVRKIQKNILKRRGFYRNQIGYICTANGDPVGKHWPKLLAKKEGE